MNIKKRRENRLRRQIAELTQQHKQLDVNQRQCRDRRTELFQMLNQILSWSGILHAHELLAQKQRMSILFHEEHNLAQQQRYLSDSQQQLQERLTSLHGELLIILKNKEIIKEILNGEYY